MKKWFKWSALTITICFVSNFSSNAYTKEDLELAKTRAMIVDLVSSLSIIFSDKLSPELAKLADQVSPIARDCSRMVEDSCSRALETDGGMDGVFQRIFEIIPVPDKHKPKVSFVLKTVLNENMVRTIPKIIEIIKDKKGSVPAFLLLLKTVLVIKTNEFINYKYQGTKYRIKRRWVRAIALAAIESFMDMFNSCDCVFENPKLVELAKHNKFRASVGIFIGSLVYNGIVEYVGEKIIQEVEEI